MNHPRIYADFHNADRKGRLRLNNLGTMEDLAKQGIELCEGLHLSFYADDLDERGKLDELLANGIVSYSVDENIWVAEIDWNAIRHSSDDDHVHSQVATAQRSEHGQVDLNEK